MYKNVTSNYSKSDVADQMTARSKNDWTGVTRNITDTLNVDYKNITITGSTLKITSMCILKKTN